LRLKRSKKDFFCGCSIDSKTPITKRWVYRVVSI